MGIEPKYKVTLFLMQAKRLLSQSDRFFIWQRKENSDTLAQLGLLYRHQIQILQGLTHRDYSETLPPTDDQPEAWVFGVTEQGREIYIKLAIMGAGTDEECLACVSFHFTDRAIDRPYREE